MVTIIHGDDVVSSRNFFLAQKKSNEPILNGENLTFTQLVQSLEGGSLFGEEKVLLIENFFLKNSDAEIRTIANYVEKHTAFQFLFWEGKKLLQKHRSCFKDPVIKQFLLPTVLFTFLQSVRPNNKNSVLLLHKTIATTAVELVFSLLIRQFRLLLAVMDGSTNTIEEVKRLASWQLASLTRQANLFSVEELKTAYQKLFTIEKGLKTGTLPSTLVQSIDFFLADL